MEKESKKTVNWVIIVIPLVVVLPVAIYLFTRFSVPGSPVEETGQAVSAETHVYGGMALQAEQGGSWYAAHIVELKPDGLVRVHFDRWDSRYDEDVPRSRLRTLPGLAP